MSRPLTAGQPDGYEPWPPRSRVAELETLAWPSFRPTALEAINHSKCR